MIYINIMPTAPVNQFDNQFKGCSLERNLPQVEAWSIEGGLTPELVARKVEEIIRQEFVNFTEGERERLAKATMEAIQRTGLGKETDITRIVQEIQQEMINFSKEAAQLLMSALERIQEILNSPDTSIDNNPSNNFPGFGSTPTSSGSVLAA